MGFRSDRQRKAVMAKLTRGMTSTKIYTRPKKPSFNRQEREILRVLYESRKPMSIREIAEKANMSWVTAKKHLKKLEERGLWDEGKKD